MINKETLRLRQFINDSFEIESVETKLHFTSGGFGLKSFKKKRTKRRARK
jgi:hypothetical protein